MDLKVTNLGPLRGLGDFINRLGSIKLVLYKLTVKENTQDLDASLVNLFEKIEQLQHLKATPQALICIKQSMEASGVLEKFNSIKKLTLAVPAKGQDICSAAFKVSIPSSLISLSLKFE